MKTIITLFLFAATVFAQDIPTNRFVLTGCTGNEPSRLMMAHKDWPQRITRNGANFEFQHEWRTVQIPVARVAAIATRLGFDLQDQSATVTIRGTQINGRKAALAIAILRHFYRPDRASQKLDGVTADTIETNLEAEIVTPPGTVIDLSAGANVDGIKNPEAAAGRAAQRRRDMLLMLDEVVRACKL